MKRLLLILFITISIFAYNLNAQKWTKIPNVKPYINYIYAAKANSNHIYVAADSFPSDVSLYKATFSSIGNGIAISKDGGNSFSDTSMSDKSVYCIVESVTNPNIIVASARQNNLGKILFSWDKGSTWEDYSDRCEGTQQIIKIVNKQHEGKELFLTAALNTFFGYRFSDNFFDNCNEIPGFKIVPYDIKISTLKKDWVFLTGDHNTEGKIFRSFDNGKTFEQCSLGLEGLRILSVQPSGILPNVVYCGADSVTLDGKIFGKGLYISVDTGRTWNLHSIAGHSVFDIKEHPQNPWIIAVAAGTGGIWVSGKAGNEIFPINEGLPENISIRKVEFKNTPLTGAGFELFASNFGDGLYKRSGIVVSVDENLNNRATMQIYPNPASDFLNINYNTENQNNIDVSISDITGTIIYETSMQVSSGINLLKIEIPKSFNSGMYLLMIKDGLNIYRNSFVISR